MGKPNIVLKAAEIDPLDNSIACNCGGRAHIIEVKEPNLTGRRMVKSWFRECGNCGARYQCAASGRPYSLPADRHTGWMRSQAHIAFDKLWMPVVKERAFQDYLERVKRNKSRTIKRAIKSRRNVCYAWLAAQLGLPSRAAASIGMLNASQCTNVIAVCEDATWTQVEAWDRERKGKKSEPRQAAIQSRKAKRRACRLLGSEEEEWDDAR